MTSFNFNHGDHHVVVDFLGANVNNLGTILDDLNGFLRHMNEATRGQAAPLWEAQQETWTKDYHQMYRDLGSGTQTAGHIGNIFFEGDRNSGRIMGHGGR